MIGKPKIIVRTHVEHALAAGDRNVRILRTRDDTLGFEKTLRFNFFESLSHLIFKFGDHRVHRLHSAAQPQPNRPRSRNQNGNSRMKDEDVLVARGGCNMRKKSLAALVNNC
jgi:hypothetical protein